MVTACASLRITGPSKTQLPKNSGHGIVTASRSSWPVILAPYSLMRFRGIRLYGARITGQLDLEAVTIPCPLFFGSCVFDGPVILSDAQAVTIRLPGCHVPG